LPSKKIIYERKHNIYQNHTHLRCDRIVVYVMCDHNISFNDTILVNWPEQVKTLRMTVSVVQSWRLRQSASSPLVSANSPRNAYGNEENSPICNTQRQDIYAITSNNKKSELMLMRRAGCLGLSLSTPCPKISGTLTDQIS